MQPRIKEMLNHLAMSRQELREAVDCVPIGQWRTKPNPDVWSVVDVLEHLAIVEVSVAGLLKRKVSEGRDAGLGVETDSSPVIDQRYIAKVRDRSYKVVTSEGTRPKSDLAPKAAWEAAERALETLRQVVIDVDGLALAEVSAPHPSLGPLNVYEWIAFIGSHESRHAAQIREIGASLEARSS
jgi:hypothetical protein